MANTPVSGQLSLRLVSIPDPIDRPAQIGKPLLDLPPILGLDTIQRSLELSQNRLGRQPHRDLTTSIAIHIVPEGA